MLRRLGLLVAIALFAVPAVASAWVDLYAHDESVYGPEPETASEQTYTPVPMFCGWVNGGRLQLAAGEIRRLETDTQWRGIPFPATTQPRFVMRPSVAETGPVGYIVLLDQYWTLSTWSSDVNKEYFAVHWTGIANPLFGWQDVYGQAEPAQVVLNGNTNDTVPLAGAAMLPHLGLGMFARVMVDGAPVWRMRLINSIGAMGVPATTVDRSISGVGVGPSVTGASMYSGMLYSNAQPSFRVVKFAGSGPGVYPVLQTWEPFPQSNEVHMGSMGGMYAGYTVNGAEAQRLYDGMIGPDILADARAVLPDSVNPTATPPGGSPPSVMPPGSALVTVPPVPSFTPTGTDWTSVGGIKESISGGLANLGSTLLWPLDFVRWAFAGGAL